MAARREAAPPAARPRGELLVETDGVLVRVQDGGDQVKVGLVAGWADGHVQQPSYVAAREPGKVRPPLADRGGPPRRAGDHRLGGGAGAAAGSPCCRRCGARRRRALDLESGRRAVRARTEIVDYYHAAEHVWTLARALHGAGTEAATAWARAHCTVLYEQGGAALRRRPQRTRGTTPEAREALRLERGYFRTNADRMDYPALRARGLPIGSGAIESAARHVVQQRFNARGCAGPSGAGKRCSRSAPTSNPAIPSPPKSDLTLARPSSNLLSATVPGLAMSGYLHRRQRPRHAPCVPAP